MTERSVCETVVRQLWQYLDGTVPPDKHELVEAHLEVCVRCAAHFDFARSFLTAVAASPPAGAGDGMLRTRVIRALAGEGFAQRSSFT
ncbi:MAG TPA: anti-sigma factor [Gemmatimonadaceae bacterium]|jgi:anti-sigma factor RsiW|nr:anti-sigma factor [Gemmatimonadaceae bacterium]